MYLSSYLEDIHKIVIVKLFNTGCNEMPHERPKKEQTKPADETQVYDSDLPTRRRPTSKRR